MSPQLAEALPKYLQIANHIRDRIIRGELAPGDPVPSERQIVADWGVSRPTATRVLALCRRRVSFGGNGTPRSTSVTWLHPSIAQVEPRLLTRESLPDEVVTYVEHVTGRTA